MHSHPALPPARLPRRRPVVLVASLCLSATLVANAVTVVPSDRLEVNLGSQPWKYIKQYQNQTGHAPVPGGDEGAAPTFNDSAWETVGIPHAANDFTTFLNQESGGGQGSLDGETSWYRTTLKDSAGYRGRKVMVEFEGAHTGDRVYINGRFIPGTGALNQAGQVDAQATHVIGFVPHIVDLTPYLKYDGTDVVAVKVSRGGGGFFQNPGFSGAFRFGQSEAGLFRPVRLHVTNLVHIPENVYAGQNTWGTYVGTQALSADHKTATVRVQTNVINERDTPATVTLTTQIVDASGAVVASEQQDKTLAPHAVPTDATPVFDETLTVANPKLWYPNNSVDGKPYLYHVIHTVSIDGAVVDSKQSTLGIRTITWDKDFPYVNGKKQYTWGASGRYDYPALGSSVPEEQQWRDLQQLAAAGGNLYRPGHSPSSPEFVDAADALGVFIVQPSGDGENGFSDPCAAGNTACVNMWNLKRELHRDIVIRDRSHPSILAWEANNGKMYTPLAQELRTLSRTWDAIAPRASADRSPDANNGDILSCSKAGCETFLHSTQFPNKPAWGAEYWGIGSQRHAFDFELAYALNYLVPYSEARKAGTFGMAQWYFADTPGETIEFDEGTEDATHFTLDANGNKVFAHNVRSIGSSMVDQNRFPRMMYYIYQSVWTPFEIRPVVKLAHHWNRTGNIQVNAFSNCPAVRLLVNGVQQGSDQKPNPWDTIDTQSYTAENSGNDPATGHVKGSAQAQLTTKLPGQVHWNIQWQSGTATAQCIDSLGSPVSGANGGLVQDTLTTAGKADHIELRVVPELVRPDGTSFAITANGSDAAFIEARVVDKNGVVVPEGSDVNVQFEVTGGASLVTYQGGTQQLVDWAGGHTTNADGHEEPIHGYHAPGDHELKFEGGLQKVALRTKFDTGTVTVTASASGLQPGSASFNITSVPQASTGASGPPSIIANPVEDQVTEGFPGRFAVTATGAPPLTFTWKKNGQVIPGATASGYQTPATTQADTGATYSVVVHNNQGDRESSPAALRVFAAKQVAISQQPVAQSVDVGQQAHFSVAATGSPKVTYQWMKGSSAIAGATASTYDTPVLTAADGNVQYAVVVTNPLGSVPSVPAQLTVNAARPPVITGQPASVRANPGQAAQFSVSVAGTAPFHYKWLHDGTPVGDDAATLTITSVGQTDVGSYAVVVSNITGDAAAVTSQAAALTLAPPGANLAREKMTYASGVENAKGTPSAGAVDGNGSSRWSSEQGNDAAWFTVDLGAVRTFNRVVIKWENAHAAEYKIQYSNDKDSGYKDALDVAPSLGGTEDNTFVRVSARYVRMQGVKRSTAYGYSMYEFEVYDSPTCCNAASNDRFTLQDTNHVVDHASNLVWERAQRGFADQGAQYKQSNAIADCKAAGARLPTLDEALAVAGQNLSTSAFPTAWTIWTSTNDPTDATFAWQVASDGTPNRLVAENNPSHALCVTGTTVSAPFVSSGPVAQKVGVGRSAHFAVTANGTGPLVYNWYRHTTATDGSSTDDFVASTTDGTYATPALAATDSGVSFKARVVSAQGLATETSLAGLTVDSSTDGFDPPAWQQGTTTTPANPTQPGTPDNPSGPGTPGDGQGGVNIALGAAATSSGNENNGYLAPGGAVDGSFTTRWGSTFVDPSWIRLDLGAAKTFDHVILRWENAHSTAYEIQVSNDDKTWTRATPAAMAGKGGVERIDFNAVTARYVRMFSTARNTQYGVSLWEFEVYASPAPSIVSQPQPASVTAGQSVTFAVSVKASGAVTYQWRRNGVAIANATAATYTFVSAVADAGSFDVVVTDTASRSVVSDKATLAVKSAVAPQQPVSAGANLALHMNALASSEENPVAFKATNVNDGNGGTRWSSGFSDDEWIRIDLGAVKPVNRVVLTWENAHAVNYLIEYSVDGKTWLTAKPVTNSKGGTETVDFATIAARYVRMHGQTRNTQYGYSVWEFEIYNTGTDTTPPTTPPANDPSQGLAYDVYPGFIGTQLRNATNGKWSDDKVFVAVIGRDPTTKAFSWVKPDGTLVAAKVEDNDGTGHLTKNGQNYPNYFFTLAQAKLLKLPMMDSGRIFVSVGEPMYIKIVKAADGSIGFAGPNPLNATDPNIGVYYDWYEFTWNKDAIFINTTQVDQFSIPLSLDVYGGNKTRHVNSGITQTRAEIFAAFNKEVPAEFQLSETDPIRILAPGKAAFDAGHPQAHYFDSYIDEAWQYYEGHILEMTIGAKQFEGTVVDGVLSFRHTNWATTHEPNESQDMVFNVARPTTQDVLEGKGALARSSDPWGVEGQLEAQICAAFNRHVMEDTTRWKDDSAFYQTAPANYYSRFWHVHGVNGKAYGFAYDDVSDQSSTLIETAPEHLELGIGW